MHTRRFLPVFVFGLMAQEPITIIGSDPTGYTRAPLVGPGELVTFIVRGLNKLLTSPIIAPHGELPLELDGISVTIAAPGGDIPKAVPILRIDQSGCGLGLKYVCDAHAVTVLMPLTLSSTDGRTQAHFLATVLRNGVPGLKTEFKVGSNITLLNDCHVAAKVPNAFCDPLVFHEDGTAVKVNSPARPGELVSIRAIGMGTLTSGFPFEMQVLFTDGSVPLPDQELITKPVDSVRFTPDAVGMYDVFVRLPEQIHPDARQCWTKGFGNTRVSVMRQGGRADFAGSVDICVQPLGLAP